MLAHAGSEQLADHHEGSNNHMKSDLPNNRQWLGYAVILSNRKYYPTAMHRAGCTCLKTWMPLS